MKTYVPESERIVHSTSIDFKKRSVIKPIHIVQYDNSLPIIAVSMFSDGFAYTLPEGAEANVRFKKPDGKVVYNPVLGCDSKRNILYFEITYQMSSVSGNSFPVIEIVLDERVAASSSISMEIDRNPIQESDIESTDEMKTIIKYVSEAEKSAEQASASEKNAKTSETNAASSASAASASATQAKASETNAKTSETNAKSSETKASASEKNAKTSETNAASSASAAATSASNASESESNALAYAERAEAADVGSLMLQLGKHELVLNLTDSDGDSILDSNNNIIKTITYFIDMEDVESLVNRLDTLKIILNNFIKIQSEFNNTIVTTAANIIKNITTNKVNIEKLKSNALLDSNY